MNPTGVILISPMLIPLITAIITLFAISLRPASWKLQRAISVVGATLMVVSALILFNNVYVDGVQAVQLGSWPMPFGITLVADLFSAIMIVMSAMIGFSVLLYSLASVDHQLELHGYYPLYFVLLLGVNGAFLTGDLFNLFVWFEVMLMSSFVLMALGHNRGQVSGAIKYVTMNLISSAIFLSAIGILYGLIGTLNMADLAVKFETVREAGNAPGLINAVAAMFLISFGIKAAIFPLFFWLPDSYFAPHPAVTAVFAGLLTKVGVYALIRMFTMIFPIDGLFQPLLMWIAGLTMLTGVLAAVSQNEVRRILSTHIISQIGYMVMGLAIYTPLAVAGAIFFLFHNVVVKTALFLVAGVMERVSNTGDLTRLGSLYKRMPVLAVLFLIPALSLAGLPPLSGFFGKLSLVQAGFAEGDFGVVAVSLLVSVLTLYSMTKIWTLGFWKPHPNEPVVEKGHGHHDHHPEPKEEREANADSSFFTWYAPLIILAVISLVIGFGAGWFFPVALQAGEALIEPTGYIEAVFRSAE